MILGITDRRVFVCNDQFRACGLMILKLGRGARLSNITDMLRHIKRVK